MRADVDADDADMSGLSLSRSLSLQLDENKINIQNCVRSILIKI